MAVLNIVVILLLGGTAVKVLRDYEEQKKRGVEPVFRAEELGIGNTECWEEGTLNRVADVADAGMPDLAAGFPASPEQRTFKEKHEKLIKFIALGLFTKCLLTCDLE